MAFSETLAERVRIVLDHPARTERKMFGGLCFMVHGHMVCGVLGDELMVRVGPDAYEDALKRPHAREMDFTGRALKGMVYVGTEGLDDDHALLAWVDLGRHFVETLPPKKAKKAGKSRKAKT